MLRKDAAPVDSVTAHIPFDLFRGSLPPIRKRVLPTELCEARAAIGGDPAHHLRGCEMARLSAHLPEAAIRLAPRAESRLHLPLDDGPGTIGHLVARLSV